MLKKMNIALLSDSHKMATAWFKYFANEENVDVVCDDFCAFMNKNQVECIVSPANSFGIMDGGYDMAITKWFGEKLQEKVQEYIMKKYYGEQPVGSSFIIDTPKKGIKLIHTPTMRIPERIYDTSIVYHCMRTCLITALENDVRQIVIPAFGARTGCLGCEDVAYMMWMAYKQILSNNEISWEHAIKTHYRDVE